MAEPVVTLPAHPAVDEATEEDKAAASVALSHLQRRARRVPRTTGYLGSLAGLRDAALVHPTPRVDLRAVEHAATLLRATPTWTERTAP